MHCSKLSYFANLLLHLTKPVPKSQMKNQRSKTNKLGWTGRPSLPDLPSDHRYARSSGPVVYQKVLAFLLPFAGAVNATNNV